MLLSLVASVVAFSYVSANADEKKGYVYHKVEAPFEMLEIREYVFPDNDFLITDFGADTVKNDIRINTEAIKKAIKACNKAGGGRVVVPAGTWKTGPVYLKSNVNLHLEKDAVLRFSDKPADYLLPSSRPGKEWNAIIILRLSILECENVAITGEGTLSPEMET